MFYKYLYRFTIVLKSIVDNLNRYLNIKIIKSQLKQQKYCKHKKLEPYQFLGGTLYRCIECNCHGSLENLKSNK